MVGGGAAGLSAALVLGRARRTTLVLDAGAPSNAAAHGIGGQLGRRPPAGRAPCRRPGRAPAYPSVEVRSATVVGAEAGFSLTLDDGSVVDGRPVLLATGMDYAVLGPGGARAGRAVGPIGVPLPVLPRLGVRERPLRRAHQRRPGDGRRTGWRCSERGPTT